MNSYALGEVEALAKKATRGAGYTWGEAEETGRAVRWMHAQGLAGCAELCKVLERRYCNERAMHRPNMTRTSSWASAQAQALLCPLMTGLALSDYCKRIQHSQPMQISKLAFPLLLLPFAAQSARQLGQGLCVECDSIRFALDAQGRLEQAGVAQAERLLAAQQSAAELVQISIHSRPVMPAQSATRAQPHAQDFARLEALAHKTYAPASEESRLLGAGAGLNDND